ncbi:MAG: GGDEF domain-containing protein [Armatimonadota bacterium]|nr:GGDEF domain-containing protein [Armatimonadota bacterium]MDR5697246.1 GGDEF domain-containing protein [Armatimonadota bacterium]
MRHTDRERILETWLQAVQTGGSKPRSAQALQRWGRELLDGVERALRGERDAVRAFVRSDLQRTTSGAPAADRLELLLAFRGAVLSVLSDLTAEETAALSGEFDRAAMDIVSWHDAARRIPEREGTVPEPARAPDDTTLKDWATDLFNESYFRIVLPIEVRRSVRYGRPLCLALLKVDNYEELASQHGPQGAEAAVEQVAQVLKESTRSVDAKCRLAADRIAVLLPETDGASGMLVVERLREDLAARAEMHQGGLAPQISAGVAACPEHADEPGPLLQKAEQALALAEQMGGDVAIVSS